MNLRPLKNLPPLEGGRKVQDVDSFTRRLIRFYDIRARWCRRFYRISGLTVILSGVSLPILVSLDYPGKNFLVSLMGTVVAGATALRAFYRWDRSWILLRSAEMTTTHAYLAWRDKACTAVEEGDEAALSKAGQELREKLLEVRTSESENFFKDMPFPAEWSYRAEHAIPPPRGD